MHAIRHAAATAVAAAVVFGTCAPAGAAMAITAPLTANLGAAPSGTETISANLGTVTVAGSAAGSAFKATVSATAFTTGSGSENETIGLSSILYWSGPATAVKGATVTPGQPTASNAVDLTEPRTAIAGSARGGATSVSWNPALVINIPDDAVAGTYTATVTHSVA